jgi:hypothetical protein
MSWETLHNFVVYFQTNTPKAKSIQEWTFHVLTLTIWQKISFSTIFPPVILHYGLSIEKRARDFDSFEQAQRWLPQT